MAFEMLNTTQAGVIARVPGAVMRRYIRDGALPATRCGSIWLISRPDLEAFLATTTIPPRRIRPSRGVPGPELTAKALLDLDGEPATADELALLVERHPGNVRKFLLLLRASGHAKRVEGGWVLTRAGEAAYRAEVAA